MKPKKDLRVIKTNNNIRNTFIKLLNEKDFHSITVQNILDIALINRKTFYSHYSDKYDLARSISEAFLNKFKSIIDIRIQNQDNLNGLINSMDKIYEDIYKERITILALWKINVEGINVYEEMNHILKNKYVTFAEKHIKENCNIEYQSAIFASQALTTLKFIIESNKNYTAHELIKEFKTYIKIILSDSTDL